MCREKFPHDDDDARAGAQDPTPSHLKLALHQSEERFTAVVENVGIGICLLDPEMRIVSLNRQMRAWFPDIDPALHPVCYRSFNVPPREEPCSYCPTIKTLADGEVHESVTDTPTPDGIRHYRIVSSPLRDHEGRVTAAIEMVEDITAARRADAALRESVGHYRALVETTGTGYVTVDLAGRVIDANAEYLRIAGGRTLDEIRGRSVLEWTAPYDQARNAAAVADAAEQGSIRELEIDYVDREGRAIPVEINGTRIETASGPVLLVLCRDITRRKLDERSIREGHEQLQMLNALLRISLSSQPLQEKLERMLRQLLKSPRFTVEASGIFIKDGERLTLAAHVGLSPPIVAACGTLPLGRCLCGEVARTGREIHKASVDAEHHVTFDGMAQHGHLCLPLEGDGKVLGVLNLYLPPGEALDARTRELARGAASILAGVILLSHSEQRFLQAQKMEAIGKLAGGVAHDFNNILTVIKSDSEFLLESLATDDPRRQDAQEIHEAGERAAALTRQLLAFSRKQVLAPRVVNLNEVVTAVTRMVARVLGEDVALTVRLHPRPVLAFVDQGQMEQVLMNLVVNARDAMPQGGVVTLETAVAEQAGEGFAVLSVGDTGAGIAPEILDHIFEPFFTTKPKGKGTGLGLSMVYGIVAQSGGDIEVESAPGRGSLFRVLLPVRREDALVRSGDSEVERVVSGTESVLVVEDDDVVRTIAAKALAHAGYRVLAAPHAAAALELLRDEGIGVDLLLTDLLLPGMNGKDLAAIVVERRPGTRVLYMSGFEDGTLARHGVLEAGLLLLPKPFTPSSLRRYVRDVLDAKPASSDS
jgi:PAS domain S-box-containing protein